MTSEPFLLAGLAAAFLLGLVLGIGATALFGRSQARRLLAVLDTAERRHAAETEALLDGVKLAFHDISRDAQSQARDDVLRLAQVQLGSERRALGHTIEAERGELNQRIGTMLAQLERTQALIRELERDRTGKFQDLANQLETAGARATELGRTTQQLARSLSGTRLRGQLGEQLAEDVLKAIGLAPGLHYHRQAPLDAERRPDFLLELGHGRRLAMDVKFPLDNYRRAVEAADDDSRKSLEAQFVKDVRQHVAAIAGRNYADPASGTTDFALLFVPSDVLFVTIVELAPDLVHQAARQAVAVVGPTTLFALLRCLRLIDTEARIAATGTELAQAMAGFRQAWERYAERAGRAERRLEETLDELRKLYGLRRTTVDKAVAGIDALLAGETAGPGRSAATLPSAGTEETDAGHAGGSAELRDAIAPAPPPPAADQSANRASFSGGKAPISE